MIHVSIQHTTADYFPTDAWLENYRENLESSEELSDTGDGWGVGWEGAMIFHITDVPVTERTMADLPSEIVDAVEETLEELSDDDLDELVASAPDEVQSAIESRGGSTREAARAELLETTLADAPDRMWPELEAALPSLVTELVAQVEENVVGDTVYSFLDLYDGGCREVEVLSSLDDREHGFVIRGDYDTWRDLVDGEANVINLIMGGQMEVDGDMQKILQYSDAAVVMTEVSAETPSRFLF